LAIFALILFPSKRYRTITFCNYIAKRVRNVSWHSTMHYSNHEAHTVTTFYLAARKAKLIKVCEKDGDRYELYVAVAKGRWMPRRFSIVRTRRFL